MTKILEEKKKGIIRETKRAVKGKILRKRADEIQLGRNGSDR